MTPAALGAAARPILENLEIEWLAPLRTGRYPQPQGHNVALQYAQVFRQRLDRALRDIEIGFIGGHEIVKASGEPPIVIAAATTAKLTDAVILKPTFMGMGVDLPRAWNWIRGKWRVLKGEL
jgi:hypothetical protein